MILTGTIVNSSAIVAGSIAVTKPSESEAFDPFPPNFCSTQSPS